jgi:hypothetical protein
VECALRGRHSNCHWVEVSKREENMERSTENASRGMRRSRMTDKQGRWIKDSSASREKTPLAPRGKKGKTGWQSPKKVGQVDLGF